MKNRPKFFLQLGRAGDILNVFPLLKRDADQFGEPCPIMITAPYLRLFEGVSYAEPVVFEGDFEDVAKASIEAGKLAGALGRDLVCTQIYGRKFWVPLTCWSFMRQSWAQCPDAPAWGSLPLEFDRRDPQREEDIFQQLRRGKDGPYAICALSGTSSPFEHSLAVLEGIRGAGIDVVDVSGFLCDRFQDILGLLERATVIVAVDSGVLHLAHAVPSVPVVALITRDPSKWHGSAWRPQHKARFFYDEMPEKLGELIQAVRFSRVFNGPRIFHVYTHLEQGASEDTRRRNDFAASTWAPEYRTARWVPLPFGEGLLRRSSGDAPIHDERPIPFMHDVIELAMNLNPEDLQDWDIIAWTNADSCFTPGLTGKMLEIVERHGCAYTHRWDFHTKIVEPLTHEGLVRRGEWYPGTDACFFTVGWWRAHRDEYPDMLVGREQNDEVLRQLIKRHGGLEVPAAIYHEKHPSFWEHHGRRMTGHGNRWNQQLAAAWFLKMGFRPFDPVWWQVEPEEAQRQWALRHIVDHGPV